MELLWLNDDQLGEAATVVDGGDVAEDGPALLVPTTVLSSVEDPEV